MRPPGSCHDEPKQSRPAISDWPARISSSGGRIRTSDLRVMSGIRSFSLSAFQSRNCGIPEELRPPTCAFHVNHVDPVFQRIVYSFVYISFSTPYVTVQGAAAKLPCDPFPVHKAVRIHILEPAEPALSAGGPVREPGGTCPLPGRQPGQGDAGSATPIGLPLPANR